ncbi:ferrochelatase [Thermostichus vulcanus]|uniref:Ferrochelatase n=1 Tax=Thermostichus vulcanus str. 'Rupite' TaxID=2813851 RepID=A0ABT0C6F1_THEVL|nr:ferrochelatase [Thermostichus vulcanus]MCJ2541367.1 ferrochelatase [Thermostichus vulcanus str. 'Rupite']
MSKSGVLLLNLGGPETQADVQPFLYNLFADPELIRLPFPFLQRVFAWAISSLRAEKSRRNYAAIGGGSPLRRITAEQARELQAHLVAEGYDVPVYVAMRYWHPFTESVVQQIKSDGITRLVVLPLYPQYSISTTGSSFKLLDRLWAEDPELARIERHLICSWYDQPDYVQAMAAGIRAGLDQFEHPEQVHVLFSAHGIPESYVTKAGDPYQQEMEACVQLIWQQVGRPNPHTLSYQSRVGSVKWLHPYTETVIPELGSRGVKHLLVVPISFVSEHIETLQEIDIEYRELAHHSGIPDFRRVPALNADPQFIAGLVALVRPHLLTPGLASSAFAPATALHP